MDRSEDHSNSEELNNLEVPNNPTQDFFYFVFDLIKTGIIVFLLAFSLRYFAIQPFVVDGESMMPNYENNEYLLAEKITYMLRQPERGDVVIFRYPGNPNVNYIKRIIALPGETIKIANSQIMIVNDKNPKGITLTEDYIPKDFKTLVNESGTFEKKVGESEYFVMGDNRMHSSDSREWGALPKTNIIGRAWLTMVPVDRLKIHQHVKYAGLSMLNDLKGVFTVSSAKASK